MKIPFTKCSGCGNDFIIVDNREGLLSKIDIPYFTKLVCRRRDSIGADGVLIMEKDREFPFLMRYFNKDGSRAEFCGNGARCIALYSYKNNITSNSFSFRSEAGIHRALIKDKVSISLPSPQEIRLNLEPKEFAYPIHYIKVLVPHSVVFSKGEDILDLGKRIRFHPKFQPEGTNVDFVELAGPSILKIRTYERGVEGETPSCGTGAVASSIIAFLLKMATLPVRCKFKGGELIVRFSQDLGEVWLEGDTELTFKGEVEYKEDIP